MPSRDAFEKRSTAEYAAALASGQRQLLQHLASGASLDTALTALLLFLEALSPELIGSILLLDPDGIHLRHGAAPSLPREFIEAIDGSAIGSGAGSCGTAAFRAKPVWVSDIVTDPLWVDYRHLALPLGFRACWSTPILDGQQQVLGTFALYRRRPGPPSRRDRALIDMVTPLAAVAIGRSRAESALRESEQRFEAFMGASPAISWITDSQGRHVYMNPAWEREFGLRRDDFIGRTAFDLVPEAKAHEIRKSDAQVLESRRAMEIFEDETVIGGRTVYWHCVKFPFQSLTGEWFIGGVAINRTRRTHAERALKASEERYRATLDGTLEGCQLIGFDWRYLYVNGAAAGHNRRPAAELLGRTVLEAWPGMDGAPVFMMMQRCMNERLAVHDEIEFVFPDGSSGWFDVRCQPVPEGIFVLSIDISERHAAEVELRQLNATLEHKVAERTAELEAARTRAESADRLKSAFLATMSHELRTPLNSIIGFTGIVLKELAGPLNAEQTKQLGMVRGSARHLLELINDVLDLSKIEAGQLAVRAEPFDLTGVLDRVVESTRPFAQTRGLALETALPAGPIPMVSDRRRVEQILLNVVNNALKFTDTGSVRITVDVQPRVVQIQVADTGIGIKPEDLAGLFQPFKQVDTGLAREHEGTGLGLAICRRLVELLGGEITATSEWARGSVFRISLPRTQPEDA
jgi:PAS domain S-box-containing protein